MTLGFTKLVPPTLGITIQETLIIRILLMLLVWILVCDSSLHPSMCLRVPVLFLMHSILCMFLNIALQDNLIWNLGFWAEVFGSSNSLHAGCIYFSDFNCAQMFLSCFH